MSAVTRCATVEYFKQHEDGATETILADVNADGLVLVHPDALTELLGRLGFERVDERTPR